LFYRLQVDALAIRGDEGRGKTAISFGERQARFDPEISEWGNPTDVTIGHRILNT